MSVCRTPFICPGGVGSGTQSRWVACLDLPVSTTVQWSLGGAGWCNPGTNGGLPCPSPGVTLPIQYGRESGWIDQITKTTIDTPAKEVIAAQPLSSQSVLVLGWPAGHIASLNLERPLQYSKYVWPIWPAWLGLFGVKDYSLCTVTGWGLPRVGGESEPSYPQQGGWCGIEPGQQARVCHGQVFLHTFPREPTIPLLSDSYLFFPLRASAVNVSRDPDCP